MMHLAARTANQLLLAGVLVLMVPVTARSAEPLRAVTEADRIQFTLDGQTVATYVFRDERILRPYFANVHAPGGVLVTRQHPPMEGEGRSADHADMHPGIWLGFGDLGGSDFWRNRGRVEHVEFLKRPEQRGRKLEFAVRNRYVDGERTICLETCRYTMAVHDGGYLLTFDITFENPQSEFSFGDQEEMGLGIRMADPLRKKGGSGRILGSDGQQNEKEVRGSTAKWCDYSGMVDGRRAGILLMQHPDNFRPSWYHARDYGLLVANPFGRAAITGGEPSRVTVRPGSSLRLCYGVYVYSAPADSLPDYEAVYRDFVSQAADASRQ